jgi:hypothetical protein
MEENTTLENCKYKELLTNTESTKNEMVMYEVKDAELALKSAINNQNKRVNELKGLLVQYRAKFPIQINSLIKAKADLKIAVMTLESAEEEYTYLFGKIKE